MTFLNHEEIERNNAMKDRISFNRRFIETAILAIILLWGPGALAQSLYDRLGGQAAIECWIDTGLPILTSDPRIADYFAGALNDGQALNLRDSLVNFACAATGGSCVYVGRNMSCAHGGLAIDHHAFTTFLKDMEQAALLCRRGNSGWMTDPAYSEFNKVLLTLRPAVVQDDPGEDGTANCSP